ncbi:hypothetical protein [Seonamhaeicola maritimus]|uniref:DUF1080 domain-containing protein n=1 Tax=Seonamhaeicola maritimus TaxID=2591822 RepID=A0A5C7GFQ1_9FLAO|nr:hypothetical protein [Seonamhaeicola maritimus]TXG36081.1 hypothetical protein FUA22_13405 [Seonamhaeicola maritimus]
MFSKLNFICVFFMIGLCYGQSPIKPLNVEKGALIFFDDFEREEMVSKWTVKEKFSGAFQIKDGVLVGKELEGAGHGSVARAHFAFSDVVIEFDLKFKSGKRLNIVMDDSLCKTVWAGHISRVAFSRNDFRVQDDKTGSMDLNIRNRRLKHPEKADDIKSFLKSKMDNAKFKFEDGKWYHVVITKIGDVLECKIGHTIVQIKSDGIAHPNLNKFGPTITGGEIHFDNFKIWSIN